MRNYSLVGHRMDSFFISFFNCLKAPFSLPWQPNPKYREHARCRNMRNHVQHIRCPTYTKWSCCSYISTTISELDAIVSATISSKQQIVAHQHFRIVARCHANTMLLTLKTPRKQRPTSPSSTKPADLLQPLSRSCKLLYIYSSLTCETNARI